MYIALSRRTVALGLVAALVAPAGAALADGETVTSGTAFNQWGARVSVAVEDSGDPNKVQIVLRAADNISWWKSLDVYGEFWGDFHHMGRVETKDGKRGQDGDTVLDIYYWDVGRSLKLDFWKGGFLGFGAWVGSKLIDVSSNQGKRIIYTWERD